jgi:hypothetical protein
MARIWTLRLLIAALALGTVAGSRTYAQGTATTGTGVRTGRGPLAHPVPPAVSTLNPPYTSQRPQNFRGPASTYPSPYPFGSRQ